MKINIPHVVEERAIPVLLSGHVYKRITDNLGFSPFYIYCSHYNVLINLDGGTRFNNGKGFGDKGKEFIDVTAQVQLTLINKEI